MTLEELDKTIEEVNKKFRETLIRHNYDLKHPEVVKIIKEADGLYTQWYKLNGVPDKRKGEY